MDVMEEYCTRLVVIFFSIFNDTQFADSVILSFAAVKNCKVAQKRLSMR